jgi:hypothetical protein
MKSSPLLGPFGDSIFGGFSLLKIKIGWVLWYFKLQIIVSCALIHSALLSSWLLSEVWYRIAPNLSILIFSRVNVLHLDRLKEETWCYFYLLALPKHQTSEASKWNQTGRILNLFDPQKKPWIPTNLFNFHFRTANAADSSQMREVMWSPPSPESNREEVVEEPCIAIGMIFYFPKTIAVFFLISIFFQIVLTKKPFHFSLMNLAQFSSKVEP